jgi:hypothetical protein
MGEGKSEGTLRISRSSIGQEQIDDPASIADDFNLSVNSPQTNLTPICRSRSFPRRLKKLR